MPSIIGTSKAHALIDAVFHTRFWSDLLHGWGGRTKKQEITFRHKIQREKSFLLLAAPREGRSRQYTVSTEETSGMHSSRYRTGGWLFSPRRLLWRSLGGVEGVLCCC